MGRTEGGGRGRGGVYYQQSLDKMLSVSRREGLAASRLSALSVSGANTGAHCLCSAWLLLSSIERERARGKTPGGVQREGGRSGRWRGGQGRPSRRREFLRLFSQVLVYGGDPHAHTHIACARNSFQVMNSRKRARASSLLCGQNLLSRVSQSELKYAERPNGNPLKRLFLLYNPRDCHDR